MRGGAIGARCVSDAAPLPKQTEKETDMKPKQETRVDCSNWDPVTNVKKGGNSGRIPRKLVGRGIVTISNKTTDALLRKIAENARMGIETRLAYSDGKWGVRFVQMVTPDLKRIELVARVAKESQLGTCLAEKKPIIVHCGRQIDEDEADELVNEARGKDKKRAWVTPDTMVECPKCGFEFRVGRKEAA